MLKELVLRADKGKGWTCYPSIAVIAEDAMCSVSSVEHALTKLVKLKLIKRKVRPWTSNLYTICCTRIEELAVQGWQMRKERARQREREQVGEDGSSAQDDPRLELGEEFDVGDTRAFAADGRMYS